MPHSFMAMQYLEGELRRGGDSDQAFADIVSGVLKARQKDVPLPTSTSELSQEAFMENIDPAIRDIWNLRRQGKSIQETAILVGRSLAIVNTISSFLVGVNMLQRSDNPKGRKRGGRNTQKIA